MFVILNDKSFYIADPRTVLLPGISFFTCINQYIYKERRNFPHIRIIDKFLFRIFTILSLTQKSRCHKYGNSRKYLNKYTPFISTIEFDMCTAITLTTAYENGTKYKAKYVVFSK